MKLQVQCYAGWKAGEGPVRFRLKDRDFIVEEILDQWYSPNGVFLKVRADDSNLYIISQQTSGVWSHSDRPQNNLLLSIARQARAPRLAAGAVRRRITPARLQESGAAEPPRRAAATALTTSCAARAEPLIVLSS
jgi:hypothetical protein